MSTISLRRGWPLLSHRPLVAALWLAPLVVAGVVALSSYVESSIGNLVLGGLSVVAALRRAPVRRRYRYAVAALIFLVLCLLVPVKTFLFFGLAFTLFFGLELSGLSLPFLGWAAFVIASPLFTYGMTAFSFPLRLQLAGLTGRLFAALGSGIEVRGGIIRSGGFEFAVDPACMGLHMLSVSLLLGVLFLGLLLRRTKRGLGAGWSLLFLAALFAFNLVSNLLRIVLLVQFRILPDHWMHDAVGLICLLVYVCVPAALLARRLVVRKARPIIAEEQNPQRSSYLAWLILPVLMTATVRVQRSSTYDSFGYASALDVKGYRSSWFVPGVLKLQGNSSLVYVKFIRGFYDTEHNPSMCWSGSGYTFQDVQEESVAGGRVLTARLVKDKDTLYTAWWYSDGRAVLTDQWQWRWQMLRSARHFAVVNVNCATREALRAEVNELLGKQVLKPVIQP